MSVAITYHSPYFDAGRYGFTASSSFPLSCNCQSSNLEPSVSRLGRVNPLPDPESPFARFRAAAAAAGHIHRTTVRRAPSTVNRSKGITNKTALLNLNERKQALRCVLRFLALAASIPLYPLPLPDAETESFN